MSNLQNEKISFKWTIVETIKGKTFPILIAMYVSQMVLNRICIAWFESKEVFFNSIGLSLVSLVCYLPAILIAIFVVWIYQNNKDVSKMMVVGVPIEELERREKKFKWHGLFGLVIGYLLWGLVLTVVTPIATQIHGSMLLLIVIGIPVLIIITYNPINKKMVAKTKTNQELIEEFKVGWYEKLLPSDCVNEADKKGILVCLERAEAHTVHGAIYVYRAKRFLKGLGKISGIIGAILAGVILIITFGVVNGFSKNLGDNIDDAFRG
ncbi:MAG: hypothetical protein IJA07_07615 [Agathobacter sp.]|nr:hypothetical protein [Agathobacter sp.]